MLFFFVMISQYIDVVVGIIMLNYEVKCNVFLERLVGEVIVVLVEFQCQDVCCVVLWVLFGVKVWLVGYDVLELLEGGIDLFGWCDLLWQLICELENFLVLVIVMIEGSVWGGVCEMVFVCDMIVVMLDVIFVVILVWYSVLYNVFGLFIFLNVVYIYIVKEMLFIVQLILVVCLECMGIVNYVLLVGEIEVFIYDMVCIIVGNVLLLILVMKE